MSSKTFPRSKWIARAVVETLQRLDPTRLLQPPNDVVIGQIGFVSVYRCGSAQRVCDLIDPLPNDAIVRLWALDEIDDRLRASTVGCGPGGRLDLLNRLIESTQPTRCDLLILADDDVSFVVGDLLRCLRIGRWLGFDLFQPAHSRRSRAAHMLTRKRWFLVGRGTTFVEEGPLVVLSAAAQRRLLPFPDDFGMGWGIEVRWQEFASELRFGVVDAVALRHERPGEYGYDAVSERSRLRAELARAGLTDLKDIQREVSRHSIRTLWRGRWSGPNCAGRRES